MILTGCADRTVRLLYTPPTPSSPLEPRLIIGPFQDVRGNEGDAADPYRVGGIYGGYGNRLAKVMVVAPWPPTLASALAAEFRARGIDAMTVDDGVPAPSGVYRLDGAVRNFSTEARWGREAHIGITVRLVSPEHRPLIEKRIDVRESGYNLNNFDGEILEELLNRAFARFVRDVASDVDIQRALGR
jgi:hypothetical protein